MNAVSDIHVQVLDSQWTPCVHECVSAWPRRVQQLSLEELPAASSVGVWARTWSEARLPAYVSCKNVPSSEGVCVGLVLFLH